MPFPNVEKMRAAIEEALHEGLADMSGDWFAELPEGGEVEFRPGKEFEVGYYLDDEELENLPADQPAEKTYTFRVRVELVEVRDGE